MTQAEKHRLTVLTRDSAARIVITHPKIKEHIDRAVRSYSPTNAKQYRALAEIVWWLIASDSADAAADLLDALCELDDDIYWMPHALASAFATRAWLNAQRKRATEARTDARSALRWVQRDVNYRAITAVETRHAIERFDGWLSRAEGERGTLTALQVISHALRVLVMYQQLGRAGDAAAKTIPAREYSNRLDAGLLALRRRIDSW